MKRILAISDSHIDDINNLPKEILDSLKNFDFIIHCGDFTSINVVEDLKKIKNFYGVVGNVDEYDISTILPKREVLEIEGFKIGITHPYEGGPPIGIKERILKLFGGEKLDLIFFGHTHFAEISEYNGVKFVNPGSSTGRLPAIFKTYAIVEITDKIEAKIIRV